MRSPGLIRYVTSSVSRTQRWVPPLVAYVALVLIWNSDPGPMLSTYADTSASLLPIAIWLTWVVANCEDPVQADVTAVAVGGPTRVRQAKLVVAFLTCLPLAVLATAVPLALGNHPGPATTGHVLAGLVGHVVVGLTGVAIGSWAGRPVLGRVGWVFLLATGAVLVELLVPHCPPTRQLLEVFDADHPDHLYQQVALVAFESVALAAALLTASLLTARTLD